MHNLFDLTGKRALITDGSRGIGYLLASNLGRYGASVIVSATTTANAERAAEQLRTESLDAQEVSFDITDGAKVSRAVEQLEQRLGPIDILVNNAGIQRRHPLLSFPEADWDEITNVKSESSIFGFSIGSKVDNDAPPRQNHQYWLDAKRAYPVEHHTLRRR